MKRRLASPFAHCFSSRSLRRSQLRPSRRRGGRSAKTRIRSAATCSTSRSARRSSRGPGSSRSINRLCGRSTAIPTAPGTHRPTMQQQTIVFALPARQSHRTKSDSKRRSATRVPRQRDPGRLVDRRRELRAAGRAFTPSPNRSTTTMTCIGFTVAAARASTFASRSSTARRAFARLESCSTRGTELEPPKQQPIDGCWSINGFPRVSRRIAAATTGTIGGEHPSLLRRRTDGFGLSLRLDRGPDYGFGAIDTAPDGKHLSAGWTEGRPSRPRGGLGCGAKARRGGRPPRPRRA